MRTYPLMWKCLASAVGVVLAAWACAAAPQLDVAIGFDSQVARNAYVPLRVGVSGLATPSEADLVVRQVRGLPGERQFPVSHTIASGVIENGTIFATIPLAEPLNPVVVELRSADGRVLAESETSLRLGIRQWPFTVVVGRSAGIGTEAVVDGIGLPEDWWAYAAARDVWLVDPPVSEVALQALGEWVVSGGSLVIFTGAGFPRLDSPTLRAILPIQAPRLLQAADGTFLVVGDLRSGARVVLERAGSPILIQGTSGAGTVSLVAVGIDDLRAEERLALDAAVPQALLAPSTERVSAEMLRSTTVPRPNYLVAPMLGAIVVIAFVLYLRFADRGVWPVGVLAGVLVVAAVLSGLYGNAKKTFIEQYAITTHVSVISSFGIHTAFASYYAVDARSVVMSHESGSYPASDATKTTRDGSFAAESEPGETTFHLQATERRDLLFHARPRVPDLSFRVIDGFAEIDNRTGRTLSTPYVSVGGHLFPIAPLAPGAQRVPLAVGNIPGPARAGYLLVRGILRPLEEWLPMDERGAWLVTFEEHPVPTNDVSEKAREVLITIIEGEAT